MRRLLLFTLMTAAGLVSAGCDEKLSSITGPTPNLEPTLSSIQANIFNVSDSSGRLACIQCHSDQGRIAAGPGLVLLEGRSYQQLVGVASVNRPGATRVIPGDPENSYLVRKLEGRDINGERMPRGTGPFLTAGQMLVIRKWISDGAPNN
jgi:hypothetical protein